MQFLQWLFPKLTCTKGHDQLEFGSAKAAGLLAQRCEHPLLEVVVCVSCHQGKTLRFSNAVTLFNSCLELGEARSGRIGR